MDCARHYYHMAGETITAGGVGPVKQDKI
jgi:hypothetical protein